MTDKQIIIEDCIHLNKWKHCDICKELIKTKDGANGKKREHLLTEEDLRCDFYHNCYYKQYKRKEQECEELKKTIDDLLHKSEIQDKILWKIDNEALLGSKDAWIYKLRQALTEIKEIINICRVNNCNSECEFYKMDDCQDERLYRIRQILQKREVLDDN